MLPDGPIKTFDIELGGDMDRYLWSMAGEYYPELFVPEGDAGPLRINYGDRVRVRFTNSTMMYHPMHLHGHFYRLLSTPGAWGETHCPLKDTVAVGPGQKIDIEFYADNPGHWVSSTVTTCTTSRPAWPVSSSTWSDLVPELDQRSFSPHARSQAARASSPRHLTIGDSLSESHAECAAVVGDLFLGLFFSTGGLGS